MQGQNKKLCESIGVLKKEYQRMIKFNQLEKVKKQQDLNQEAKKF